MMMIRIVLFMMTSFFFAGCSSFFQIGANKGYCEEHGCDYSDAGFCIEPYTMYQNKDSYGDVAYKNIDCSHCSSGRASNSTSVEVIYQKEDNDD